MKLKTVSFNIRFGDDVDGYSVAERAPRLRQAITDYAPDLIGIQEYTPKWEDYFEKLFLPEYEMYNKYRATTGWIEGGPVLWRRGEFVLIDRGDFWYSDTPDVESGGWDVSGHKRNCVYVKLRRVSDGAEFVFMNTHFGFGEQCQIKSAELIKQRVKAFGDTPYFITGDFNATPETPAYKILTSFMKDANAADLTSITYHGYHPGEKGCCHIDYCFIGGGVTPLKSQIITNTYGGKFPSDHYGLYTELQI